MRMRCGDCGREVPDLCDYCPHCGSSRLAREAKCVRCACCGRDVPPGSDFCQWCGSNLRAGRAEGDSGPGETARRKPFRLTLFNPRGRLNRLKYFYVLALFWIAYPFCISGLSFQSWSYGGGWVVITLLATLLLVFSLLIISMIKRFHDLNEPGVNVLFIFVPFYNIYIGVKLLFFDSVAGINNYGENDGNGHYWQAPIAMLLIPALALFGSMASYYGNWRAPAAAEAPAQYARYPLPTPTPLKPAHYYNAFYRVSMDTPAGWLDTDMDGFLLSKRNWLDSRELLLEVVDAGDDTPQFPEFSEQDFTAYKSVFEDKYEFAGMADMDADDIVSDIAVEDRYVNGYRFVQIRFMHSISHEEYRHYYICGIYDSKVIVIQLIVRDSDGNLALDELLACADTFRFGDDAEP
jgi:uncharacterized membrane protein YhaH (DUF805 family)